MDVAVKVNEVVNPKSIFVVGLRSDTSDAPTITAKPIIRQLSGRIICRYAVSFPMVFSSISSKSSCEYILCSRDKVKLVELLDLSLSLIIYLEFWIIFGGSLFSNTF